MTTVSDVSTELHVIYHVARWEMCVQESLQKGIPKRNCPGLHIFLVDLILDDDMMMGQGILSLIMMISLRFFKIALLA